MLEFQFFHPQINRHSRMEKLQVQAPSRGLFLLFWYLKLQIVQLRLFSFCRFQIWKDSQETYRVFRKYLHLLHTGRTPVLRKVYLDFLVFLHLYYQYIVSTKRHRVFLQSLLLEEIFPFLCEDVRFLY